MYTGFRHEKGPTGNTDEPFNNRCAREDLNFHREYSPPAPQAGASTVPPRALISTATNIITVFIYDVNLSSQKIR